MATTDNFRFEDLTHPFELSFPFIDEDNLVVTLDGVVQTLDTDYTVINKTSNTAAGVGFLSGARIQFTDPLPATGAVKVVRNTNLETTSIFKTGSAIRAIDLNSNFTQNLYVTEEISNNAVLIDGSNVLDGDLDLGNNQINNLGDPTSATDAATKGYVDTNDDLRLKRDGTQPMTGNLSAGGNRVTSVADPVNLNDAVNKSWVSSLALTGITLPNFEFDGGSANSTYGGTFLFIDGGNA
jgi:hypothetical protein